MENDNAVRSRRWFEEGWNQRRTETVDEILAEECNGHMEGNGVVGRDSFKQAQAAYLGMFPDLQFTVEQILCDGDDVAIRWTARGTHAGDGQGFKATGRPIEFRGTTWHRYRNGKLVEGWDHWNQGALLQQIASGQNDA